VRSVNDGVQVLYTSGYERSERRTKSGLTSLSVADMVGAAYTSHLTAVRTVRRHQVQLTQSIHINHLGAKPAS